MELSDLLRRVTGIMDRLGIAHFVTGSVATIAYGEPRLTNDVDLVVRLAPRQVGPLCEAFPQDEFYISPEAAIDAVERRGQFNILHPASGLKIDLMVAGDSDFDQIRFERVRLLSVGTETPVAFASPEDVILKKLQYFGEGGSDKHLRDISGVLKVMGPEIDMRYLLSWAMRLGVSVLLREVLEAAGIDFPDGFRAP